jgi:hypothetical protein
MKNLIKQIIKEELDSSYGFFKNKTNIPDFDSILFNQLSNLPQKYHDWYGEIKFLSPEEYINECARLQDTSYQDQFKYINKSNVDDIKENMKNGLKYNMPYLNYVNKQQEGRHRVIAASQLGQNKIPVLCLYQDTIQNDNNVSDMIGKWDDLIKIDNSYYVKFKNNNDFKSKSYLLQCIAKDYDYYFLDDLFYILTNKLDVFSFLKLHIKVDGIKKAFMFNNNYVNDDLIKYNNKNNISKDVLKIAVAFKTLYHNMPVIEECVKFDNNFFYLKLLNVDLYDNINYYQNGKQMLLDNVKYKDYINSYDLLSLEDDNQLYKLTDADVKPILNLISNP